MTSENSEMSGSRALKGRMMQLVSSVEHSRMVEHSSQRSQSHSPADTLLSGQDPTSVDAEDSQPPSGRVNPSHSGYPC